MKNKIQIGKSFVGGNRGGYLWVGKNLVTILNNELDRIVFCVHIAHFPL